MSYLALARKWRPRTFSQLVGQDHINKALTKSLDQQRLHHAYLFTGTRGVGKTSIARLLAKALNCEKGITPEPCLTCEACIAIEQGRFIDLLEIDGASKTRVEDTRELLENVQYAPTAGRYKIYLIDEVHMLSQHSFNALLKTLEEPPLHVKFLLATTDPQKLPITVLSRCLQFNLRHIAASTIAKQLIHILNHEAILFDEEAINILAEAAHGSMRDALSLLDQAIASSTEKLNAQEIRTILGYTQQNYALQLLQTLIEPEASRIVLLSRQIETEGGYFVYVLEEILSLLHQITVYQTLPDNNLINFSPEIKQLSSQLKPEDIQLFYQIGIKGLEEIQLAPTLLIGFEMVMFRMLTFKPAEKIAPPLLAHEVKQTKELPSFSTLEMVSPLPKLPITDTISLPNDNGSFSHLTEEKKLREELEPEPKIELYMSRQEDLNTTSPQNATSLDESPKTSNEEWSHIIKHIKLTGLAQNAVENAEWVDKSGKVITLNVARGHQSLFNANVLQRIEQALSHYFNETIKIKIIFNDTIDISPAKQKKIIQSQNQQEAEESLQNDPVLQALKIDFSAELVKNSIEPL